MPAVADETPTERVGDLWIGAYDKAIFAQLGAFTSAERSYVPVNGVQAPSFPDTYKDVKLRRTKMPGVPAVFAGPHDAFHDHVNPSFVVRRQDPQLALERWNSQRVKYVVPATGAVPVTATLASGFGAQGGKNPKPGRYHVTTVQGWSAYETQPWSWPYDLFYSILARVEGDQAETLAQRLLLHVGKRFPPRDNLDVTDSLGSTDGYAMFVEGPVSLNEVMDISHRVRGWSFSVRVCGYLDFSDPETRQAVKVPPQPSAALL